MGYVVKPPREGTQRRLLTEQDLTLENVYTNAHGMEAAKQKAGELRILAEMPSNVQY